MIRFITVAGDYSRHFSFHAILLPPPSFFADGFSEFSSFSSFFLLLCR